MEFAEVGVVCGGLQEGARISSTPTIVGAEHKDICSKIDIFHADDPDHSPHFLLFPIFPLHLHWI